MLKDLLSVSALYDMPTTQHILVQPISYRYLSNASLVCSTESCLLPLTIRFVRVDKGQRNYA